MLAAVTSLAQDTIQVGGTAGRDSFVMNLDSVTLACDDHGSLLNKVYCGQGLKV